MPLEAVDFDPFAPADPNLEPVDFDPFAPATPAFDEAPPDDLETVGPVDRFLDQTSVGRVLDAFGAGARDGWGESPLGLSPESEQALRENGIFPQASDTWGKTARVFNEAMIRPAAAALDAGMRSIGAVVTGAAAAVGQTAEELGADQGMGARLSRDTLMLAETLAITTGSMPTRVGPPKMRGKAAKIEAETPKATDVFKPVEEAAPEFAGNINLSRINAAEDVKDVIREAALRENPTGMAPRVAAVVLEEVKPVEGLELWHTSPFTFDKFKMGTGNLGTGAGLEGKGLYFGENRRVAETYADYFVGKSPDTPRTYKVVVDAKPDEFLDFEVKLAAQSEKVKTAVGSIFAKDKEALVEKAKAAVEKQEATIKALEDKAKQKGFSQQDTDAALAQPRDWLKELRADLQNAESTDSWSDLTGRELYVALKEKLGGDVETTQALRDAGIKGTRFPDKETSGATSYVVYDDALVKITDRYLLGAAESDSAFAVKAPPPVAATPAAATDVGFMEARRGTISLAQTEEMAQALGMSAKDLTKRNIGEAFNAEELTAARNLLVQSATDVRTLAAKAAGGADTDLLAFQEAMARHAAIQEQVAGLTAEAGRALSSFRISASAVGEAQDLGKIIETLGGRSNIEDIARKIGELDTPQQVSKFLMDARTSKTSDKLLEVWINGLLSGPQTHIVNITSNTLIALNAAPETALASAIGKVRTAVGYGTDERVLAGEAGARLFGFIQGAKEGIVAGYRTFKSEMPSGGVSKLEVRRPVAVGSSKVSILGKEFELGGRQVRIPGRMLMAEDEVFKAMGYRQELNALAIRKAGGEGLTGRAKSARIAELTANPTKDMMEKAVANAEYQTFTNNLGKMGAAVQRFSQSHPAVKLVIPFVRTPVNILKYAGNRTPLALFSQDVRKAIAAGTAEGDTYLARIVTGSSIGAASAALASEGYITGGGPRDPRQRALLYADGWQPYSVRIGDMYYSFGRFEPLGTLMGVAADMVEISKYTSENDDASMAGLITASIAKNMVSKVWLSGPSALIEAVSDPDRYGEKYVQRLAGSVVPTIAAQATRVDDPYLRDARTMIDAIKARVPGLSTDLPVRRGIWGEPIQFQGGVGPDFISPAYESYIQNDPVNKWLLGLKVWPAQVRREIKGVELTPAQYDDFTRIAGRFSKMRLDELVAVPGIKDLPKFAQVELVQKALADSRERARTLMLLRNPKIIQDAVDARKKEIAGD